MRKKILGLLFVLCAAVGFATGFHTNVPKAEAQIWDPFVPTGCGPFNKPVVCSDCWYDESPVPRGNCRSVCIGYRFCLQFGGSVCEVPRDPQYACNSSGYGGKNPPFRPFQ